MVAGRTAFVPIKVAWSAVRPGLVADLETGFATSGLEATYHLLIGASVKT
jgi:hypothetical protein